MKTKRDIPNDDEYYQYMRIHFAGLAMQGLLSENNKCYWGNKDGQCVPSEIAKDSVEMADAMLKELKIKKS